MIQELAETRLRHTDETLQHPSAVGQSMGRFGGIQEILERGNNLRTTVHQLVGCENSDSKVWRSQFRCQFLDRRCSQVGQGAGRLSLAVNSTPHNTPNPAMRTVALGMIQLHLVVPDDRIVEVGNVQGAIRSQSNVNRAKPLILTCDEIRLGVHLIGRAETGKLVSMHLAGDGIADKEVVAILGGKMIRIVVADATNPRGTMIVRNHVRPVSETIMRFAETGIISPTQEHSDGPGMAVGIIYVSEPVKAKAERVHLTPSELFETRTVGTKAIGIAGLHLGHLPGTIGYRGTIGKTMTTIYPAVDPAGKGIDHAVRIDVAYLTVKFFALVSLAVAIVVFH